jgi:hypothetical protein
MVQAEKRGITRDQLGLALRYFEGRGLLIISPTLRE